MTGYNTDGGEPYKFDSGSLETYRWDDLSNSIIAARLDVAAGRLDYDYFNAGVSFASNALYPSDPVVIPVQCRHAMLIGTGAVMHPHFHWLQRQIDRPNFLLGYKKVNNGTLTTFETDFSNYTFLTPLSELFEYAGDATPQITLYPEIDTSDLTISAAVNFVLFRDTTNESGLFDGADPVSAAVTVTYQDQHVKFDGEGSRQEFVK